MMPTRSELAKIHIAAKELGMDGEPYKFLLWDRFKVNSAKDLDGYQVSELLRHFRKLGWRPKLKVKNPASSTKNPESFIEIKPGPAARQQRYCLALWNALGYKMKNLHNRCKKQFGIERFEWVTDFQMLHALITDLQVRCKSAGIDPAAKKQ